MIEAEQLVIKFGNQQHPLGKGIAEDEIPFLVSNLIKRVEVSEQELNLSPRSLDKLAKLLLNYYQKSVLNGIDFTEENIVQIVREITAYLGKVILIHSKGKWNSGRALWDTEIVFDAPSIAKKGNETRTYPKRIFTL